MTISQQCMVIFWQEMRSREEGPFYKYGWAVASSKQNKKQYIDEVGDPYRTGIGFNGTTVWNDNVNE